MMRCFDTEEGCADGLGNIYNIYFAVPPIRDATLRNILTPLLVVHFVGIVRRIVNRRLKHDYVQQEGDLSRVRGRVGFLQNFRRNIIIGRADRVFCRYSELSVNTCENRLIKLALLFAERIVGRMLDQVQLALYYGIVRFISDNTRKRNWGAGIIDGISKRLKAELPGLRGLNGRSLKNMRSFYEAWSMLEPNSPIQIGELSKGAETAGLAAQTSEIGASAIQDALADVKRSVGKDVVKSVVKILDFIAQHPDITRKPMAHFQNAQSLQW